jgi:quercetin dioxygenase-like cupin family protein
MTSFLKTLLPGLCRSVHFVIRITGSFLIAPPRARGARGVRYDRRARDHASVGAAPRQEDPMSDPDHQSHHRPHSTSMAEPLMEFDLEAEVHRLKAETTWSTGHNARTLVKHEDMRVVLIAVQRDARMPEHQTEGRVAVQVISGHVQIRASGRTFNLRAGGLLTIEPAIRHDVTAIEESVILLTIAWPGKR